MPIPKKFENKSVTLSKSSQPHVYNLTDDSWYMDAIKQYEGSSYYDTLLANPYLVKNAAPFQPGFGDRIAEAFGDYSAGNRYYADLHNRAAEELRQNIESMRQQEYNSAPSQLQQAKLAGSNPDLAGGVQPGSAAENDQPMSPVEMPGGADVGEVFGRVASVAMSAYSFASGFVKDIFSFQSLSNGLKNEDLQIYDKIRDSVRDFVRDSAIRPKWNEKSGNWTLDRPDDAVVDAFAKNAFRSRRSRRLFTDEYFRVYNSARNELARITDINDSESAVKALNFTLADNMSYGYNYADGPNSAAQTPVVMLAKELTDLRKDLTQVLTQFQYDKAGYDDAVVQGLDAFAAANAQNETNKAAAANAKNSQLKAKVDEVVNKNLNNIISKLEKMCDEPGLPGVFAQGLLLYYSAFGLQLPNLSGVAKLF